MTRNIAFGGLASLLSIYLVFKAFSYPLSSSMLLRFLCIVLLVMSISYLVKGLLKKDLADTKKYSSATALFTFVGLIVYLLLIQIFGYVISTFACSLAGLLIVGRRFSWIYPVYALALTIFIFFLFFQLLHIGLPNSYFELDELFIF